MACHPERAGGRLARRHDYMITYATKYRGI